jgi:hypothetical protein
MWRGAMHPAAIWRGAISWRWARKRDRVPGFGALDYGLRHGADWYGFYAMAMASIALVLHKSGQRPGTDLMMKFLEHFAAIRAALDDLDLSDDEDGMGSGRHMTLDAIAADLSDRLNFPFRLRCRRKTAVFWRNGIPAIRSGLAGQSHFQRVFQRRRRRKPRCVTPDGLEGTDSRPGQAEAWRRPRRPASSVPAHAAVPARRQERFLGPQETFGAYWLRTAVGVHASPYGSL